MTVQHSVATVVTAAELAALPEDDIRHDLVEGELIEMSRPKPRHGYVAANLSAIVGAYVRANTLGRCFTESGFVLAHAPDIVRGPDFAFVAAQRNLADSELDDYIEGAPDFVVEIVSPNDMAVEVRERLDQYFAAGARLIWVIYPLFKTVEVYRADQTATVLRASDELGGEDVLPGLRVPVEELFR